ncbi:MAG: 2-oxoglutarate and iron-dependent oxygenase domain-containing protein [Burkholderiaceae bacterium]
MTDDVSKAWAVPVIDIGHFHRQSTKAKEAIAAEVDSAAREVGFMQITGHGIDPAVIAHLGEAIDGFFGQTLEKKLAFRAPDASINRGYTAPGSERLSYSLGVSTAADLFEAFNVGTQACDFPALALPEATYPKNIWPNAPGEFKAHVSAWFREASQLARTMTRIFALALALPEDYFVPFQDHSLDVLRLNYYALPGQQHPLEQGQMGMGAHTDFGIVTILWADRVTPGLQVLDRHGDWHDVVPLAGALLINLGDMLARWTNDRWVSTMHRVLPSVSDDGRALKRRSAAFFHDGNFDAIVSCLPGCWDARRPQRYAPVTVAEHVAQKLAGSRGLQLNADALAEAQRLHKRQARKP